MADQSIEEKYLDMSAREHIMEKPDMWAGSSKIMSRMEYVIRLNGKKCEAAYKEMKYPPALFKCFDEPLVNMIDHLIRCEGSADPVTYMRVNFDHTGWITMVNNGPGIEIEKHKKADIWVPEFIFGELFRGSNLKKPEDSIIGGTNGVGAKLSNVFSQEFIVETVDSIRKRYYRQRWLKNMSVKEEPVIHDLPKRTLTAQQTSQHTMISFLPDYQKFGYEKFDNSVYDMLDELFQTRVFYAAAYVGYSNMLSGDKKCKLYYNDVEIPISSMNDLVRIIYPNSTLVKTTITPEIKQNSKSAIYRYPWEICVALSDQSNIPPTSNVNGIVVSEGKHIKKIIELIQEGVKNKIMKVFSDSNVKFNDNLITNSIFLAINAKIPNPAWTGQRKDVLDMNVKNLAGYTLPKKFVDELSKHLKDHIIDTYFTADTQRKKKTSVTYDKYNPARKAGTKQSKLCSLIMLEGDSAMTQISTGVTNNPSMGFEYYGLISLGGVIVNARKECSVMNTANGKYIKKSTKLTNNAFINALMEFTGLNPKYKYDPEDSNYQTEISELKYGCVIGCVDQDYDGVGNIFGLVLNIFELYWPNLIKAGFVKRFETPSRRAYPRSGGTIVEFYNQEEYITWCDKLKAQGFTDDTIKDKFEIKYYKGLGTHSRDETIHMFKDFKQHLITYEYDEEAHEVFEIYFGSDPEKRKVELSKPIMPLSLDVVKRQAETKRVKCSEHLRDHTFIYQKDNLDRKLDSAIDGMNQAGRKIYDGIYKAFKSSNKPLKVAQLGGYISEHESYHHGEGSLNDSITGKAFTAVGGKQIPQIVPLSNFGSRKCGGRDAASARYIYTRLNKHVMDVLYPPEDYYLLEFNFDEGQRNEPKYFAPIIPTVVLDSNELPGHGWKLKVWGRDVFEVIRNVRRMIKVGDDVSLMKMAPNTYRFKGKVKSVRGQPYSFGCYRYDEKKNTITITELPLRVWTEDYVKLLKSRDDDIVYNVVDASDDLNVNIDVKLKQGAWEKLQSCGGDSVFTDAVEEYFLLRNHMDSHLNFMGKAGEVLSYKNYEDVFYYWFPVRKLYYEKRITRQIKLLQMKIVFVENIARYVDEYRKIDAPGRKTAEIEERLAAAGYTKFNCKKLANPKYTQNEDLEEVVYRGKANYDYLIDLSDRKKTVEEVEKRKEELAALNASLDALKKRANEGRFIGAAIWESELDKLEEMIRKGRETDWLYDEKHKHKFA